MDIIIPIEKFDVDRDADANNSVAVQDLKETLCFAGHNSGCL
jgi:hypothetical protein